jgi:hypothetical protein
VFLAADRDGPLVARLWRDVAVLGRREAIDRVAEAGRE